MRALTVAAGLLLSAAAAADTISGPARVIDGDTLLIGKQRVRLQNAHAPERGEPGGSEATAALKALVVEQLVVCEARARDRYARMVARCSIGERDLGHTMVAAGLAEKRGRRR